MYLSAIVSALPLLASSVAGLPVRRGSTPPIASNSSLGPNDLLVLQFAEVLEQLETQFYTEALQKFQVSDFVSAGFSDANVPIQQFTAIQSDENTHVSILQTAISSLGGSPISGCSFDFSSVLTSVSAMAPVARLVENVGVGAYLGAAHLVSDPVILTDAASIVTIEARHQTVLNILNSGTAIPTAFDLPLLPQEVLALAGGFISGCSIPGIDALPSLTVTNTGTIEAGTTLSFEFDALSSTDTSTLSCQMLSPDLPFSLSLPFDACTVPSGLFGPVAIYVTNDTDPLVNSARDRFLGDIVAGPTMAFLDKAPEAISSLAVSGSDSSSNSSDSSSSSDDSSSSTDSAQTSVSTATISPDEASSILASASATGSADASDATAAAGDAAQDNAIPPSANQSTGPSADGATTVNGWTFVPASS